MIRKKHISGGLVTLALAMSLLRIELSNYFQFHRGAQINPVLLGQTMGLVGVDLFRDMAPNIKDFDSYADVVFRGIRSLAGYPLRTHDVVSAWLVNGSGSLPNPERASDTNSTVNLVETEAASNSSASINTIINSSDPTVEDMDLIDILWQQDIDMGVGREMFDPGLRLEMEKERQLEQKKQAQKEAAAAEAARSLLMSNFTVDRETGELIPLVLDDTASVANTSLTAYSASEPLESVFWGHSSGAPLAAVPSSYSLNELTTEHVPLSAVGSDRIFASSDYSLAFADTEAAVAAMVGNLTALQQSVVEATSPATAATTDSFSQHHSLLSSRIDSPAANGLPVDTSSWSGLMPAAGASSFCNSSHSIAEEPWPDSANNMAYDFAFFPCLEDEEESDDTEASLIALLHENNVNFDMDPFDADEGPAMEHHGSFFGDDASTSSDSAISMGLSSSPDVWMDSSSLSGAVQDYLLPDIAEEGAVGFSQSFLKDSSISETILQTVPFAADLRATLHNHTYPAPPGGQPHVRKMDMKKQSKEDANLSRDERRAKELSLPFSVDLVVMTPVEEFNELAREHALTDAQLRLVRDIRRRGKNKLAAQNCRRRKLGALSELEESLESLRERRRALLERRTALGRDAAAQRAKVAALYRGVFSSLRDEHGAPYDTDSFELRVANDDSRRRLFLVPAGSEAAANSSALSVSEPVADTRHRGGNGRSLSSQRWTQK